MVYNSQVINQHTQMANINLFEEAVSRQIDDAIEYTDARLTEEETHKLFEIVLERAQDSISDIIGELLQEAAS